MNKLLIPALSLVALSACTNNKQESAQVQPNILIIYVDDLGYGDIGINGAIGVETPGIDQLAENGLNFTDAHCTASTCTPSRFSLLTGSYAFRNNAAILPGDAPLLIDPDKGTIASMLQKAGYTTGVVGKWHLGLGRGLVNWNEEIIPGPREIGFDYSFLIPATGDRVPCVFLENQKVVGLNPDNPIEVSYGERLEGYPVGTEHPELLKMLADVQHSATIINGVSRIGYMSGGEEALWVDEDFPTILTDKAKSFITENKANPFFLYFSLHDIHVPRVTNPDFVGKSTMGPRGDAIAQVDWCTSELVKTLEELGLAENTLIIFSSDNGPVLDDGYADKAVEILGDHKPAGIYRGGKYSAFEAGTRMPTIVYWPGKVQPGVSDAMLSQVDLYASFAGLVGQEVEEGDAPDSRDYMDAWLGKTNKGRDVMLEEAFTFALRHENWKYIHPQERETPEWLINKDIENGLTPDIQLYDLSADPSEQKNLASEMPDKVAEMQRLLEEIRK